MNPTKETELKKPCNRCREQKVYCDKLKPICNRCNHSNSTCTYTYARKKVKAASAKPKRPRAPLPYNTITLNIRQLSNSSSKSESDNTDERSLTRNDGKIELSDLRIHYYNNLKVDVSSLAMTTNLFKNSVMQPNHKVFVSTTGKLDYFGVSPIGLLLTMYVVHHTKPENLNNCISDLKDKDDDNDDSNANKFLPISNYVEINSLGDEFDENIRESAIDAFFNYFNSHLPLINRRKFILNYSKQPNVLKFLVIGIGMGYLPFISKKAKWYYCHLARLELTKQYNNINTDTITALLIISTLQSNKEDCKTSYATLGQAIRMSYCLGLHLSPPDYLNKDEKEIRVRLYWIIHILDKHFGFGMTLPFGHDYRLHSVRKPVFMKFDYLDTDRLEFRFMMLSSIYYISLFSEICQMFYIIKLRLNFIDNIKESHLPTLVHFAQITEQHFNKWAGKVTLIYKALNEELDWKTQITDRFELNLKLVYNSTLIKVFQTFSNVKLQPINAEFKQKATHYAKMAIECALKLKNDFFYYGSTYKFYALSTATFYWIKVIVTSKGKDREKKLNLLKKVLKLIENCKPYYLLADECLRMAKGLAISENLDID